ncbi:hypothetical protein BDF20DRAFT_863620 [Mycotypha africana]|uniref:uncharacterized protein n=1 Tax=Mycotypha africana TaxID=64632 RepID=UPI0023019B6A|nr:uncharacterized protein BDF20DRAFT_863620 [Mycotypha africana]KAI8981858.1 hypothetical protein BDF20DRAFT_863620 [Mycotypha africana]
MLHVFVCASLCVSVCLQTWKYSLGWIAHCPIITRTTRRSFAHAYVYPSFSIRMVIRFGQRAFNKSLYSQMHARSEQ